MSTPDWLWPLAGLWPLIWKYSTAALVIAALAALAALFAPLRRAALAALALAVLGTVAYSVGVRDEHQRMQAKWDAAQLAEIAKGASDRAAARRAVGAGVPDWVRADGYNRDTWPEPRAEPEGALRRP